ncbi:hypothetical protein [Pseudoalteromonas luteoviolacea]|uniref:hypothetical protein n=1 Tax=Pseudoalteromonas luteoviolacea TaxID=43657 RepID=UPI00068BB521|nr:hypothetical protein [Pseudoalteromonas luteoviolacea]
MLKTTMIGAGLLMHSAMGMAAKLNTSFTEADMILQDGSYTLNILNSLPVNAAVFELSLQASGTGDYSSELKSVCTQFQGSECMGAYVDTLHSELLYEVEVEVRCDGQVLFTDRQNRSEFTNEPLASQSRTVSFDTAFVKLQPVTCQSMELRVATLTNGKTDKVQGTIRLSNTTSQSSTTQYGVIK